MATAERRAAAAAFATLALVLTGHGVLETARDALFLRALPATQLPWVYLIIALLTLAVTSLEATVARGVRRRDLLTVFLLASSALTAILWAVADFLSIASIWMLYVWTGVFATVATLHFWLSLSASFTVTQAKRLFGVVGAGALVGAMGGSALARVVVSVAATRHLVLVGAGCVLLAALSAHCALRPALRLGAGESQAPDDVRLRDALSIVRGNRYVQRIVAFVLLSTIAITLADYVFKREVAATVAPEALGPFFATFYAALNAIALVVQLIAVGWLLDRVGVPRTLAILPGLLVGGGLSAVLGGGLPAAMFLRGTNGALRHSVHRTATEVLFVPLSDRARDYARTAADAVGHRIGQALASLFILAALWLVGGGAVVTWGIVLAALGTTVLALRSRRRYLDLFRARLGADFRRPRGQLPPLDRHATEVLVAALDSPHEREVLASLDILHEQGRIDLVPALILHHRSSRVVRRALRWFVEAGRTDFVATALRIEARDAELGAALLRAVAAVEPNAAALREALESRSRRVRATAVVQLTALGRMRASEAHARLRPLMRYPEVRRAVAAAMAVRPCPPLEGVLSSLARDGDPSVRAEAVHAMAVCGDPAYWPVLRTSLRERALRPLARRGFVIGGCEGLAFLVATLEDEGRELAVRLHVPRSIARFEPQLAVPPLWSRLAREPDPSVRYKILRALGSLARRCGGLALDADEVGETIAAGLERCARIAGSRSGLDRAVAVDERRATVTGEVLRDLLDEELEHELEQVFRVLALRHPEEAFRSIHRGLGSDDPVVRASCEELLSEVLPHEHRRALLELVTAGPPAAPSWLSDGDFERVLASMIEGRSEAVASIASSHAAELGAVGLSDVIALRARRIGARELRHVLERASERLVARASEVAHG